MIGRRYKIKVNYDPTGAHGWMTKEIEEVFVPELNLYINAEAAFVKEDARRAPDKWEEVRVDASGCMALQAALIATKQLKERIQKDLFEKGY